MMKKLFHLKATVSVGGNSHYATLGFMIIKNKKTNTFDLTIEKLSQSLGEGRHKIPRKILGGFIVLKSGSWR